MNKFFPVNNLVVLNENDFNILSPELITLKNNTLYHLVLFYYDNNIDNNSDIIIDSSIFYDLLSDCSELLPINSIAVCNITPKILHLIQSIKQNVNHPFNSLVLENEPFILIYKNKIPQKIYKETMSISSICNLILNHKNI